MTTTPSKHSQSLEHGRRPGLGSQDTQAAVSANTREERGARADSSPRDADAAAPPRAPTAATAAAREPRPRRQAVCSAHPPCRLPSRTRPAGATHSHSAKPQSLRFSPSKNDRLAFPRRRPHKSSGHLPLPGACGVYTPRRRSEPLRAECERVGGLRREEEGKGGARGGEGGVRG